MSVTMPVLTDVMTYQQSIAYIRSKPNITVSELKEVAERADVPLIITNLKIL